MLIKILYRNTLENWFLTSSAASAFEPASIAQLTKVELLRHRQAWFKFRALPCQIPHFSICFGILLSFIFTSGAFAIQLPNHNPLAEFEALIASTEGVLVQQKKLKSTLETYVKLHDAYLLDMENKELLVKVAKVAESALETIKKDRLSTSFDASFISEMTLFAKLIKKPALPKLQ